MRTRPASNGVNSTCIKTAKSKIGAHRFLLLWAGVFFVLVLSSPLDALTAELRDGVAPDAHSIIKSSSQKPSPDRERLAFFIGLAVVIAAPALIGGIVILLWRKLRKTPLKPPVQASLQPPMRQSPQLPTQFQPPASQQPEPPSNLPTALFLVAVGAAFTFLIVRALQREGRMGSLPEAPVIFSQENFYEGVSGKLPKVPLKLRAGPSALPSWQEIFPPVKVEVKPASVLPPWQEISP